MEDFSSSMVSYIASVIAKTLLSSVTDEQKTDENMRMLRASYIGLYDHVTSMVRYKIANCPLDELASFNMKDCEVCKDYMLMLKGQLDSTF